MCLCARDTVEDSEACGHGVTKDDDENGLPEGQACSKQSCSGLIAAHVQIDAEPKLDKLEPSCCNQHRLKDWDGLSLTPSLPLKRYRANVLVRPAVGVLVFGQGNPAKQSFGQGGCHGGVVFGG